MDAYFGWFGLPGSLVLTSLLSLTALILALRTRERHRLIAFAAMLCCSCGDIVLAGLFGIDEALGDAGFFLGAGFFIVGHLVYIAAYRRQILDNKYKLRNTGFYAGILFTAAVFVVITAWMVLGGTFPGFALYGICAAYACIIGANLATIWSFSWSSKSVKSLAALGVLSFFVSDLIIGIGKLCGIAAFDWLIWWLYPVGQLFVILFA